MSVSRRALIGSATALAALPRAGRSQTPALKIGVMNDQSGTYADLAGPGSVVAARMAIEDFAAAKKGIKVEVLVADHLNKPDVGSNIARQWYDRDGVDVVEVAVHADDAGERCAEELPVSQNGETTGLGVVARDTHGAVHQGTEVTSMVGELFG